MEMYKEAVVSCIALQSKNLSLFSHEREKIGKYMYDCSEELQLRMIDNYPQKLFFQRKFDFSSVFFQPKKYDTQGKKKDF